MRNSTRILAAFLFAMLFVLGGRTFVSSAGAETADFMHTIPVVLLTADEDDLWNESTGMLTEGESIDKSSLPFENAAYRANGLRERPGHIQMIMPDGTVMFDQDMTFHLYSLYYGVEIDMPQKPFEIHALQGETFRGRLFDQTERDSFTGLVLSNNGSDAVDTNLRDVYVSALLDAYAPSILHQAYRPVAVYLNGTYWGLYALGEAMDAEWLEDRTGIAAGEATMLRPSGTLEYGLTDEQQEYAGMITRIRENPPSASQENLEYLLEHVDADAWLEYMAVFMFLGDSDPGTIRIVNGADGRWRPVWQGNDYCLYNSRLDSVSSCTDSRGMGLQHTDNTVFLELLKIDEYRERFLTELGKAYRFFTTDRLLGILEPVVQTVQNEMLLHSVRWCHEDAAVYTYGNFKDDAYGAYQWWLTRVERLRNTCRRRPACMWSYIQEGFNLSDEEMKAYFGTPPASWQDIVAEQ